MKGKHHNMHYVTIWCTLLLLPFASPVFSQSLNENWRNDLKKALENFSVCQDGAKDKEQCNRFLGESLSTVYKVNDFYSERLRRYLMPVEISKFLKESNTWTLVGPSYDQRTLTQAQELANSKKAVVAVYMNAENIGHVVLITPGKLQPSGSWGYNVPNAASFFVNDPEKSFMDKGLSYAFPKNLMKDILIYTRKYQEN